MVAKGLRNRMVASLESDYQITLLQIFQTNFPYPHNEET